MLNQSDHQSFLVRQALRHQQGKGHQGIVVDQLLYRLRQQRLIATQLPQEQEGAAALVTVGQRVVLDHEVQQVHGTAGHVGSRLQERA